MMDSNHVTKRILRLTLEVIYLLTGEEYAPVKKCGEYVSFKTFMDPELPSRAQEKKNEKIRELIHKILHLLTGEVPIRCEDIMVCFSMEEWEYVEGHKDLYKEVLMEDPETFQSLVDITTSGDTDEELKTDLPCKSVNKKEGPAIEEGSRNSGVSYRCESPLHSLDCTEEDFDVSQDSSDKYGSLPSNQEDGENNEREESDSISQQNNDEENDVSDYSADDETLSNDCKLEADDISKDCKPQTDDIIKDCKRKMQDLTKDCKTEMDCLLKDCKQEMDGLPKDCKQEMGGLTKDCKWEDVKKLKGCKYEDDGIEQYYEEELLKDVKIEVVSDDDWEEETSSWGEQGRDLFMEENTDDLSPDLSSNRIVAERHPRALYPHCKKVDGSASRDYQPPILPGEKANKSDLQTMPNCPNKNETEMLTNSNVKKCVKTFPACQYELMSQISSPAAAQAFVQMGQQQKNINTARKTTSDIQTLQNFMSEMNENRRIEEIPHTELDTLLSKFILLVKRKDGNEYEPHTLRCMVGSIDRFLKEHSYNHTIIYGNSKDFPLTKQSLNAKIKFLKKIAESNPPIRQEALTDDDIENLFKTGTLSLDNPTSLLNFVFFNNGIHFALRTKEQYSLQWGDIKLKIDPRGNRYLEYSDRQTEMVENRKNVRQMKPRIYAAPHVPDRDPVTAYLKYQSFRPSAMMTPDSPFYLAPNVNYNPAFSEWYRSTKIGIQKIRAMMTTMKIRASLPESKRKVSYITKRRLVERLPQHTLAASGAMVPTAQQKTLQSFTNKSAVMEMKHRKPAIMLNNLHTTLARPSQERLPTTSSIQPHPSTSRYGELPIHKRSFLVSEFAQQRNSNMYLNNYRYLMSEEPAKKRKPIYDFKK